MWNTLISLSLYVGLSWKPAKMENMVIAFLRSYYSRCTRLREDTYTRNQSKLKAWRCHVIRCPQQSLKEAITVCFDVVKFWQSSSQRQCRGSLNDTLCGIVSTGPYVNNTYIERQRHPESIVHLCVPFTQIMKMPQRSGTSRPMPSIVLSPNSPFRRCVPIGGLVGGHFREYTGTEHRSVVHNAGQWCTNVALNHWSGAQRRFHKPRWHRQAERQDRRCGK